MASTVFVNSVTLTAASWFQDVDNVAYQYLSGVAGTNTITATGPAGLGAYAAGLKFRFIPAATNTGATTINITGTAALGARNIFNNGLACVGGELTIGIPVEIVDDGTRFQILSQGGPTFTSSETAFLGQNTNTTVNHGLGSVPRFVNVIIRNKTAESGYSIGDEVYMASVQGNQAIYADATVVGFIQGNIANLQIQHKTTFGTVSVTAANWKFVFRAWR